MKILLGIILFACACCFAQETRDTVYVEVVTRDTVYIAIKPKTDTVYIKNEIPDVSGIKSNPPKAVPVPQKNEGSAQNSSTNNDPMGNPTPEEDFTPHLVYLHTDLIGILNTFIYIPAISASIELPLNAKNSILFNYAYAKKGPAENSGGEVFNNWIYEGYIKQHAIGFSYRHYTQPRIRSTYREIGSYFLMRECNYINTWDNTNLINERPHSDNNTYYGFQIHVQQGHAFRGTPFLGVEYGFAYNVVPSFDDEILKKHAMYLTSGLQLNLKINLGIGAL